MTLVYIGIAFCGGLAAFSAATGHTVETAIYVAAALITLALAETHS